MLFAKQALTKNFRLTVAAASLSICLVSQGLPAFSAQKSNFQLPVNSSLDDAADNSDTAGSDAPKPGTILPPLTLTGAQDAEDNSSKDAPVAKESAKETARETAKESAKETTKISKAGKSKKADETPTYKLEESKNEFVPKGPAGDDSSIGTTSVVTGAGGGGGKKAKKAAEKEVAAAESLIETAKKTNSMPVSLIQSQSETQQRSDQLDNSEQKQISQLWEATLQRSPDIQFVVQKLVPTSDGAHTSTVLMRLMTTALYAGVSAAGTISPGQSSYAMQNGAANVLGQISGAVESKNSKKANLNQAELIALYQMVRNTADKMVDHYRDYKKNVTGIQRATADFEDLKAMAAESTSRPIEVEYTLRKQKRDIDYIADDVHRYRQNLIDLAGSEAVDKLDADIARELQMLGESAVADDSKPTFTLPTKGRESAPANNDNKLISPSKPVKPAI